MPKFMLFLLGAPYLERDGVLVEMDTRKALALLAYLSVSGGSHMRDSLALLLWPDYDESRARGAFRRTLSTLNKALGGSLLEISRERVALEPQADLWVDVLQFRSLLAAIQAHTHARHEVCRDCLPLLEQAASLYQGDFMNGFSLRDSTNFDDWQFIQAEALRQELGGVLEKLARGLAGAADYEAGLQVARRWLALDPLREEAHRCLMQLYEWSGQHSAALRQYRECVRVLDQELGVPPLEETSQLYQSVQERHLASPIRLVEVDSRTTLAGGAPEFLREKPATGSQPFAGSILVGRADDLQALWRAYQAIRTDGFFFALQGEAGIGKTRLAQEFLARTHSAGAEVVTAHCYEGETSLAYGPVIEVLRVALRAGPGVASRLQQLPITWLVETSRLLPELASLVNLLPNSQAATNQSSPPETRQAISQDLDGNPGAQSRFLEGLSQVLTSLYAGPSPGVLFFDDLHWADNATLDLLTYLVRRLAGRPLFILAAWRDDLVPDEHILQHLIIESRRLGRGELRTLHRLDRAAVDELVRSALPSPNQPPEALVERLFQEAEGLPFFVIEYLRALERAADQAYPAWEMPQNVRDLLRSRLERAGETGWQLLTTAAVIGRSFEYDILRAASGRSELEIVEGLEHLLQLGLIQERSDQNDLAKVTYDFSHEKIRNLVYEQTSLARRRLLHQRTADAYAARLRQSREAGALAAYHYQLAGQLVLAAEFFKGAGELARSLYANRDAIAHFQSALACGFPQPAELHEAIGDLFTLTGEYQSALLSYETAAALCSSNHLPWIEHRLGILHHLRGDWELAECHFEAAAANLDTEQAQAEKARLLADWSRTAYRRANTFRAQELAQQALELAQASGDLPALAHAHNMLGMLARSRGEFPQAIQHLQQSLEIASELKDPGGTAAALNNLARVHAEGGDHSLAIELTMKALDLCIQQGDRHREAALHNNLADLYHALGDSQAAMQHLKQAVAVFAEIGLEAGEQKPEIWMLTEW